MSEAVDDPPAGKPAFPCPPERRAPLPSSRPKPPEEDPQAQERLARILASPTYRRVDQDVDFLGLDELRPSRLQLEYLKVEMQLLKMGVQSTIVVFGGTRIVEPASAGRRVERIRCALEADPGNGELARDLGVAESVLAKSHYYDVARELGRIVGLSGRGPDDHRLVIATGGGPGLMEAANRGAFDVGAHSVGLNIQLPREQYPNPYAAPDLSFQFRYFALRKMHFMLRAKALVVFPGGYGTLDELFETLCLIQTRKREPLPVILVGETYWRRVFDAQFLADEGTIDPEDLELFWYAETAEQIWSTVQFWYDRAGTPLFE